MAAAEYYGTGGPVQPPPPQPARPHSNSYPTKPDFNHSNSNSNSNNPLPYPLSDAPPPYSALPNESRPQPPHNGYAANNPYPSYPPPQHGNVAPYPIASYPPPQQNAPHGPSGLQNMYRPQDLNSQPYPPQQQQQPYPSQRQSQQNLRPAPAAPPRRHSANPSKHAHFTPSPTSSSDDLAYSHARSRSHSRPRHSNRHHSHGHSRHHASSNSHSYPGPADPVKKKKKSTGVETFLGAGGGAIIGDAIFPGLGTLGGVLLGGLGGHEYGKQRRSYSDSRAERPHYEDLRERPSRRERESSYAGEKR